MKILISGASFLLPKNKAWNSLALKYDVEFADYGNWSGSLLQAQYQSRAKFVREKKEVLDEESYLKIIQLKPAIEPITSATISRAEQLCAKTNQFNLRTIRHTAADLQQQSFLSPLKVYCENSKIQ